MKTNLFRACILTVLAVALGSAQIPQPIRANIPFNFILNGKTLPAGDYTVAALSSGAVRVRSEDGNGAAMVLAHPAYGKTSHVNGRLEFRRYGNQYFFAGAWDPGNVAGIEVSPTKRERELVAALAVPITVTVASR